MARAEPMLLVSKVGTGKTHLATELCVAACCQRCRVRFTADTLLRMACAASNDREPPSTPRVLAVDDWIWRRNHR